MSTYAPGHRSPFASRLRCATCRQPFDGEAWQRECWACWRTAKDRRVGEQERHRGYAVGYRDGQASSVIDQELLVRAIALCHPDRHPAERAAEANHVCGELLKLRARRPATSADPR
jgi:hypothetical protein